MRAMRLLVALKEQMAAVIVIQAIGRHHTIVAASLIMWYGHVITHYQEHFPITVVARVFVPASSESSDLHLRVY